ncbi:hypothetical protein QBC46DRAFT_17234 [Diplogelasinospora grovesii]|uniref:Heterokaryon incompatibility domain-containing protein n=1 Tax=Diplogelasinospora grovesii TaxID=303347 RepID=A0AAN6S278_9PEZI|nr:hypothetical protein QBC46DRAFT_17234 [Diplogelasinospora grovesii]
MVFRESVTAIANHREPQRQLDIPGGTRLVQIFPHMSHTMLNSTWATRGWTFQEGFLPRRRLIFTDQQVAFLCNEMYCAESVRQPLQTVSYTGNRPFLAMIPSATGSSIFPPILEQIATYSTRLLSYDSDALNAILGSLTSSYNDRASISHLCGVPVLTWFSRDGSRHIQHIGLEWRHDNPARRRQAFPSWSWVGWEGPVNFIGESTPGHEFEDIQAQDDQGHLFSLQRCSVAEMRSHESGRSMNSTGTYLYLTGTVVELKFATFDWDVTDVKPTTELRYFSHVKGWREESEVIETYRKSGLHCVFTLSNNITALAPVFLDGSQLPEANCLGLVLPGWDGPGEFWGHQSVIILNQRDDFYERIGIVVARHEIPTSRRRGSSGPATTTYVDGAHNVLDKVTIREEDHVWLNKGEVRTIKLG